ncbi:MAG: hypothetical protein ACK401_01885 [Archaeoglobaceae archaeon]
MLISELEAKDLKFGFPIKGVWLKILSSQDRKGAIKVASSLRSVGARVEVRECIDWDLVESFAAKGRMSELKEKGIDVKEWEKRIEILRDLLKSGIKAEDLPMELLKKLYPDLHRRIEEAKPEENEKIFSDIIDKFLEIKLHMKEIEVFMALNNLRFGEQNEIPEDPIVLVETESEKGKAILKVSYYPIVEVYVDVLSLLDAKMDEIDEFEGLIVAGILEIVTEIISKVQSEGSVEIQKLQELSRGVVESDNFDFAIDCSDAFEAILRSMEKFGILRITGNRVKIKGK